MEDDLTTAECRQCIQYIEGTCLNDHCIDDGCGICGFYVPPVTHHPTNGGAL